jgi:hypothetical protein
VKDTPQVLLEHYLKQLKLPTMLREYAKRAEQCAKDGVDFQRFLLRLVEAERLERDQRATERRENVLCLGNSGTGKTHIALALGRAAGQRGLRVRFTTAAALVHELMEARDEKRLLRFQEHLLRQELLVVDELGFVPLSKTGAEMLFEEQQEQEGRRRTISQPHRAARGGENSPVTPKPGRSVEMPGLWKAWKATGGLPTLSTSPLGISPKGGEIPTFPQLRRRRPMEKWKTKIRFPTASIPLPQKKKAGLGRASPSATVGNFHGCAT